MALNRHTYLRPLATVSYIWMFAALASALPITNAPTSLHVEISGPSSVLQNYTIGLYDLSRMTAQHDDPDFQVQALQADRVCILQQYGSSVGSGEFEIKGAKPSQVGIFLLRNATLKDFSLGNNAYKPIFSTEGAPGSGLFSELEGAENESIYSLQLFQSFGQRGGVAFAGPQSFEPSFGGITITLTTNVEPSYIGDQNPRPIVPEPATLALVGLGISAAGLMHRRRTRRA